MFDYHIITYHDKLLAILHSYTYQTNVQIMVLKITMSYNETKYNSCNLSDKKNLTCLK